MLETPRNRNPYSPDVTIFLVLIPFISAFNYYLTYTNIRLNGFLVFTFLMDTAQGYLAWWAVRAFILFLDKRWPLERGSVKRLVFQLISTTIIGLVIISVLTELVSWIVKGRLAPLSFYTVDLFIIGIWFIVVNAVYIGLYYYNEWQKSEAMREGENRVRTAGILVRSGKQDIRLNFEEVAGFFVDGEYVVASHADGKKYYLDQSLDKLEKTLPSIFFFRVNRQYILNRQLISGFKRAENGKLLILLNKHDIFPAEIPMSRTKASAFKSWFRPE